MTDRIEFPTPTGPLAGEIAVPTGAGPWPAVVVVHDALGLSDDIRRHTERFAAHGYLALAPQLYARGGVRCVVSTLMALQRGRGQAVDDILAARDYVRDRPDCTGKVGIAGFCMGGGFALILAPNGFDASAPFYPSTTADYDQVLSGSCPVVASYGRRDVLNIGRGPKLQQTLQRLEVPHDVHTYPEVGHSFANELPGQAMLRVVGFGHDAAVTEDAYRRVFAFFGEHLGDK